MRKIVLIGILALCVFIPPPVSVSADVIEQTIFESTGIAKTAESVSSIDGMNFRFPELLDRIKNRENVFDIRNVIGFILSTTAKEVYANIRIMMTVVIVAVIWGIISSIQSSYNTKAISDTAFFAFYAVFLGLISGGLKECISLAYGAISDEVLFMKSAIPVYAAIMMTTGNIAMGKGMEAIFLYFIQLMSSVMEKVILPLVFWVTILNMVNCITDKFSIKKLIDFVKQSVKWGLGILMTVFTGMLGMSGIAVSMADGLGVKTLKFTVGNFVPVVGGLLSDTISTVLSSAIVLKNAMGVAGVIVVILICAVPLIKMLSLILVYKLSAALIEPMCDKRITTMLSEAGGAVTLIFSVLLTVTVMFILGITIIISAGNRLPVV